MPAIMGFQWGHIGMYKQLKMIWVIVFNDRLLWGYNVALWVWEYNGNIMGRYGMIFWSLGDDNRRHRKCSLWCMGLFCC